MASNQLVRDYGHWDYCGYFNPGEFYGFVYLITNKINGRKYIGKKNFITQNQPDGWKIYIGSQA